MLGLGPALPILSPAMRHAEEPTDFSNLLRSQWQFTVQSRSESGFDSKARVLSTVPGNLLQAKGREGGRQNN